MLSNDTYSYGHDICHVWSCQELGMQPTKVETIEGLDSVDLYRMIVVEEHPTIELSHAPLHSWDV